MSDDPQRLLAEAGEPGAERFTISLDRALDKLARYQLSNPRTYVLKLVQWAIASQATVVHVSMERSELRVEHDGQPVSREEAGQFLWAQDRPELLHLGIGLRGALSLGAQTICLSSWDHSGAYEIEPTETGVPRSLASEEKLTAVSIRGVPASADGYVKAILKALGMGAFGFVLDQSLVVTVAFPLLFTAVAAARDGWDFLHDSPAYAFPEITLLRTACKYAPVPVFVNQKPVNRPLFGMAGHCSYADGALSVRSLVSLNDDRVSYLQGTDCWIPVFADDQASRKLAHLVTAGQPMRGCRATILREIPGKHGFGPTTVLWVKDGVVVWQNASLSLPEGFTVVACAHDLDVDLSQFRLVDSQAYRSVVASIDSTLQQALSVEWESRSELGFYRK